VRDPPPPAGAGSSQALEAVAGRAGRPADRVSTIIRGDRRHDPALRGVSGRGPAIPAEHFFRRAVCSSRSGQTPVATGQRRIQDRLSRARPRAAKQSRARVDLDPSSIPFACRRAPGRGLRESVSIAGATTPA
jgi:hypothetical protein